MGSGCSEPSHSLAAQQSREVFESRAAVLSITPWCGVTKLAAASSRSDLVRDQATLAGGREEPPALDWPAVAALLAESAELPAVLLGASGEVLLITPAAGRALGWAAESVGSEWIREHVEPHAAEQVRSRFEQALSGALRRFEARVVTARGVALASFEARPVGGGLLLLLEQVTLVPERFQLNDYDYEVQVSGEPFVLNKVWTFAADAEWGRGKCYEVLHGRSARCTHCPIHVAMAAGPRASVRIRSDLEYELTTATATDDACVRVTVRRLAPVSFAAILAAKMDELSERARLSTRERDVFGQLVEGHPLDVIAAKLSISARTVKFHQANLLAKLGADSRSDLMRLIF